MNRPRIACFHGQGSNSLLFRLQCSRLVERLQDEFEFCFFDAPFECEPGAGVLPSFADYGPFRAWVREVEVMDEYSLKGSRKTEIWEGPEAVERIYHMIEEAGDGGEWVGVLGFSQGARAVAGILLDQQLRRDEEKPRGVGFKFGVLCMGMRTPLPSEGSHVMDGSLLSKDQHWKQTTKLITSPTLHLHGLKDISLINARKLLRTYFAPDTTTLLEINYHHAMPWTVEDVKSLADSILELHRRTREDN